MNTKRDTLARSNTSVSDATVDKTGKNMRKKKDPTWETVEAILVALLAAFLLRIFVIQAFRIPTGSMKDTLLIGDFLLVNKFIYGVRTPDNIPVIDVDIPHVRLPAFKKPLNGDIVVFKYPEDPTVDYIKRCIAVAGQTIEVRDGEVFIDGKAEGTRTEIGRRFDKEEGKYVRLIRIETPAKKTYTIREHEDNSLQNHRNFGPRRVPEGHYFMMGDNRDNSLDSRAWGFLPHENVVGEALIIYFSWDKTEDFWNLLKSVRWMRIANLIR
jgi:signal peptidase I